MIGVYIHDLDVNASALSVQGPWFKSLTNLPVTYAELHFSDSSARHILFIWEETTKDIVRTHAHADARNSGKLIHAREYVRISPSTILTIAVRYCGTCNEGHSHY